VYSDKIIKHMLFCNDAFILVIRMNMGILQVFGEKVEGEKEGALDFKVRSNEV
jgi:hypothetical protein